MRLSVKSALLGVIIIPILSACGGGSSGTSALPGAGQPVAAPASAVTFGTMSTAPFAIGQSRLLAPSEAGYGGDFTVSSSNPAVVGVSPASGPGPFTLTALTPGTSTITAADGNGNHNALPLTVSASLATPAPGSTPLPIATGTPVIPLPISTPVALPVGASALGGILPAPTAVTAPLGSIESVQLPSGDANLLTSIANPAIATVTPLGNGLFDIVGAAAGTTGVTLTGSQGTSTLTVTVPATPALITVPENSLTLGVLGTVAKLSIVSAGEAGYTGAFTASVANTGVATVAPVLLTNNQFLVITVGSGMTILTVEDAMGNKEYVPIDVQ